MAPQAVPAVPAQLTQPKDEFRMDGPSDPLEHFRKHKCLKGHGAWDEKRITFVIDHQAYALFCKDCDKHYFVLLGRNKVMSTPDGWAEEAEIQ